MQAAHRLKGTSLNLGCTSLAEATERLEVLGRGDTLPDAGARRRLALAASIGAGFTA